MDNEETDITQPQSSKKNDDKDDITDSEVSIVQSKTDSRRFLIEGISLTETNCWADANDKFQLAIKYDPKNLKAWLNAALCLQKMEQFQNAFKCYLKILEINPNNEDAKTGLSVCNKRLNKDPNTENSDSFKDQGKNYAPKYYSYWSTGTGPKKNLFQNPHRKSYRKK